MALTVEAICNMALSRLGANLVTDLDTDSTVEADICNANYEFCRDFVLEARDWTFARSRVSLTLDSTAPEFGWSSRFAIPSDCIALRLVSNNSRLSAGLRWAKEGAYILCDESLLYIAYTKQITDVTLFSPGMVQALVFKLGSNLAIPLTENSKIELAMEQKYEIAIDRAGGRDGIQGVSRRTRANTITSARGGVLRYDEDYLV